MSQEQQVNGTLKIHFAYTTLILVGVIILLVTFHWTELPKFTDYLSAAATITSLVLGLLAIIYAYVSNDSLSKTTGAVAEAALEAQNASTKLSGIVTVVEDVNKTGIKSNERLEGFLCNLEQQINLLSTTATTLDKASNEISDVLPNIPLQLGNIDQKLERLIFTGEPSRDTKEEDPSERPTAEQIEKLAKLSLRRASLSGILLIHTIYLSKTNQKPISGVMEFLKSITSEQYFYGYVVALRSCHLIAWPDKIKWFNQPISECPEIFTEARAELLRKVSLLKSKVAIEKFEKALENIERELGDSRSVG